MDNILLNEISKLEETVILYKFGVCTTGIDTKLQSNAKPCGYDMVLRLKDD